MIVCSDCGSEFEKPEIYREAHSLSAPPFEERRCCPFCNGDEYCSDRCRERGEAMWRRERLRRRLLKANPISRIIKAADEYNAAHGTNYSYGEFVAYIMPEEDI